MSLLEEMNQQLSLNVYNKQCDFRVVISVTVWPYQKTAPKKNESWMMMMSDQFDSSEIFEYISRNIECLSNFGNWVMMIFKTNTPSKG